MKKVILFIFLSFFVLNIFSTATNETQLKLNALNFTDDIFLYGVTSHIDFFYPLFYAKKISGGEFSLTYSFTQLVGPDSMYTVFVNDDPLYTFNFLEKEGNIRIKIPERYLETGSLLKISLGITLDYSICDNRRIDENALWFRITKETALSYSYESAQLNTISEFFSLYNPKSQYRVVFDSNADDLQAVAAIGEHLGFISKGFKNTVEISPATVSETNNIVLATDDLDHNIFVEDETLYLSPNVDVYNALKPMYYNYTPSSSITIMALGTKKRNNFITLERIGVTGDDMHVIYTSSRDHTFPLDMFGGVPKNAVLNLNFAVFDRLHTSGNTLNIFLNDYLLKAYNLNDMGKTMFSDLIEIPSDYFRTLNTLTFDMKNMMSDCDEFTVKVYPNSFISYSGSSPLKNPRINDFSSGIYGNTLYVVSEKDKTSAENLIQIAFEKGKTSTIENRASVFEIDEILETGFTFDDYDSIVFLINSEDINRVDKLLNLTESFTLKNIDDEILFSAASNGDYDIVRTFNYNELPAILFTHFGKGRLMIDEDFTEEIKKIPGNLGILTQNETFSFEIGEKNETFFIEAGAHTQQEELIKFWERYKFWIIMAIAALILILILVSYKKTSKGR